MAKRAGIRKVVKWGGLAVSVLLAIAWVGSCWYWAGWRTPGDGAIGVADGLLVVREPLWPLGLGGDGPFTLDALPLKMEWWFVSESSGRHSITGVPLWIPLLIAAGATAAAWRADTRERRRQRVGSCPACGYDRRGLEVGRVCPECGAAGTNDQMAK